MHIAAVGAPLHIAVVGDAPLDTEVEGMDNLRKEDIVATVMNISYEHERNKSKNKY